MTNVHLLACLIATGIAVAFGSEAASAQEIDAVAYFQKAGLSRGEGLARKTKLVDVRPAEPGEVVVTIIKGEGKETQSAPAKAGDKVVRNRCDATGNEEILVKAATFVRRYDGPVAAADASGWRAYRPRGNPMKFVVVAEGDGAFTFKAPWGEQIIARPGDMIVQDPNRTRDTYRIAKAAFDCTYEVVRQPLPKSNTRSRQ